MSTPLTYNTELAEAGNSKPVKGAMLKQTTLRAGNEIVVYEESCPADKYLFWGFGYRNKQAGNASHIYAQVKASGNGSATAGDAIKGDLIAVITDSEGRDVLHRYNIGDLETLADAAADPRTERPIMPALAPIAREDQRIQLRIVADEESDGAEIDPSASSARIYHGKLN
ncbi:MULTISPECIES: hypothetical protein [unclassified Haloferax]|uniref:hypothetical protein n=1 Tax=unclassified Haloferax TaxID=2625095 RepID=UPI000737C3D3|nr:MULTISPECIES: hypothetical protein [unclassified Haloferax]RDZ54346.1 hypothetical protein C5C07_02085 [Haloferax sp. Atlit-4N]